MKNTFIRNKGILLAVLIAVAPAAVHADPSVSALWAQSIAAEADDDFILALKYHKELLPRVGSFYGANLRGGWLYYQNKNYEVALECYEKAAGQSFGAISPLLGAMNCHVALGEMGHALRAAKSVLVIDPLNYSANLQLASIYYAEKKYPQAAAYYRKLNRLYPEDLAVASGLAWSCLELGECLHAAPLFKKILLVSPDYAYAQQGLDLCDRTLKR